MGIVLYEICHHRHPFDADNQGALILKILRCATHNKQGWLKAYMYMCIRCIYGILGRGSQHYHACSRARCECTVISAGKFWNHTCIYGNFGRGITMHTVMRGVYIRSLWQRKYETDSKNKARDVAQVAVWTQLRPMARPMHKGGDHEADSLISLLVQWS